MWSHLLHVGQSEVVVTINLLGEHSHTHVRRDQETLHILTADDGGRPGDIVNYPYLLHGGSGKIEIWETPKMCWESNFIFDNKNFWD